MGNDVNYLTHLSTWLKPVAQSKSSRWKRCWRASVDGWAASTFHGRCDNKGPTVTIIRVGGKYIFGGYTSLSWGKLFGFSKTGHISKWNCLRKYLKYKMLLPRRGLKKRVRAVSNFIALIPFRSIRQMEVNYSGFKFEKFLPNIRKRKSLSCVHVPHKTKIRTFYIVFGLRIRRHLNSVLTHFPLRCFPARVFRTIVSSAVVIKKSVKMTRTRVWIDQGLASLSCS